MNAKHWNSYIYGREHAEDFEAYHIANRNIIKVVKSTLPKFTIDNAVGRNQIWRNIDSECSDVFWTAACRSGMQFHNDGILGAKRVVLSILGKTW